MDDKKVKKFEHKETEVCLLCEKSINTSLDKWNVIIDFNSDSLYGIGFYHKDCLNDLIKAQGKVIENNFKNKLSKFVGGMLNRLPAESQESFKHIFGDSKEIYEVK